MEDGINNSRIYLQNLESITMNILAPWKVSSAFSFFILSLLSFFLSFLLSLLFYSTFSSLILFLYSSSFFSSVFSFILSLCFSLFSRFFIHSSLLLALNFLFLLFSSHSSLFFTYFSLLFPSEKASSAWKVLNKANQAKGQNKLGLSTDFDLRFASQQK